jgi:hypothetical protein
MTKYISRITVLGLLAAALIALPALSRAEDAGTNAPAKPGKHAGLVFRGKVSAIDTKAMTLTVETRTFAVTSDTKITKDGKPATLADGVVGEPVGGAYTKTGDGKLNATTIHFGVKKKTEASDAGGNK